MTWTLNGESFSDEMIGNYVGFVYLITEISTGRQYIGQKIFYNKVAKKPLKGKTKRRISKKDSNWRDYYGSNEELNSRVTELGPSNYKREIIRLCKSKSEMNYYEAKFIFVCDAIIKDSFFNSWVSTRINSNQINFV